jgi:hypothetical protein
VVNWNLTWKVNISILYSRSADRKRVGI